jgi:hypothetical protein
LYLLSDDVLDLNIKRLFEGTPNDGAGQKAAQKVLVQN